MIEFLRDKFDGLVIGILIPFLLWYMKIVGRRLKNTIKGIVVAEIGDDLGVMAQDLESIKETVTKLQITYADIKNKQKDVFILIEDLAAWGREMSNILREHHKVNSRVKDVFYQRLSEINKKYRS